MAIDLDFVKRHLRIDGTDDDVYLAWLTSACIEEISALTGIADDDNAPERFRLACVLLIAHRYDNRQIVGQSQTQPFGLSYLIQNLRMD